MQQEGSARKRVVSSKTETVLGIAQLLQQPWTFPLNPSGWDLPLWLETFWLKQSSTLNITNDFRSRRPGKDSCTQNYSIQIHLAPLF